MPVIPELGILRVTTPSVSQRSARSYSASSDADDPTMRYPRAASASWHVSPASAIASSSSCQPSSIRPAKTSTDPSVVAAFRAASPSPIR